MNPRPTNPDWTLRPEHAAALEALLRELATHHELALAACREHRAALARADHHAIGVCVVQQQEMGNRLAELELRRVRLVVAATPPIAPPTDARRHNQPRIELRLGELAARSPAPWRERLIERAAGLRQLMNSVEREQASLRQASESLLSHMKGLMAQVSRQLSSTGTYTRTHAPSPATATEHAQVRGGFTGIDLTT